MFRWLLILSIIFGCRGDSSGPRKFGDQLPYDVFPSGGLPVVNLKSYGAVGNGVADDRPALASAITAACGLAPSILFVPPGDYSVSRSGSSAFSVNIGCDNLVIQGVAGKSRIIQATGMPNAPVSVIQVTSHSHITFRDIIVDGNWQNAVGYVSSASSGVALPTATINLVDASFFPSGGGAFTVMTHGDGQAYITCTGKTATTLTGCSGGTGTLYENMVIGYVDAQAGINQATQSTAVTTIAAGSDGATLPQSTINVAALTGFSAGAANIWIKTSQGYQLVACTASGSLQLTGCTGGTGTVHTGYEVFANASTQGRNPGINLTSAHDITISNVTVQRIYGDCIDLIGGLDPTQDVRILNSTCNIASRDGISFSSSARNVLIDNFTTYSISAQAFDGEPVAWPVRNVEIAHSAGRGWWNLVTHGSAPVTIGGGNELASSSALSIDAWHWRVHDNLFEGSVIVGSASDIVFDNNTVRQDYANDDSSPIWINGWTQDVTISNNTVYTRSATSGTEGQSDCCGILAEAFSYGSSGAIATSINLHITGNNVHVRNGRSGIVLDGVGQLASGTTGTASAVGTTVVGGLTYATMTDSGASWTAHQWIGAIVRIGTVEATVQENTTTLLTLNHVESVNTLNTGWFTVDTWDPADVPALGTYKIYFLTGAADVSGNIVDGEDDGYGKGKYCYIVGTGLGNVVTTRARVHHNVAKDCDTNAYVMHSQVTNAIPYVEFSDNYAYDDQATPTTTNVLLFTNALKVTKFVMRDNQKGEGVTNLTSGLAAGTWLVNDGVCQEWAGYGTPESNVTAPICARYTQVNSTTSAQYTKESGSSSTGWKLAIRGSETKTTGALTPTIATTYITTSGTQAYTLAAGDATLDGVVHNFVITAATGTPAGTLTPTTLADGSSHTISWTTTGSFQLAWDNTNSKWRVVGTPAGVTVN